jgi:hypothetical protein
MGGGGGRTADDLEGMADHPTIGTPDKGELSPAPSDQVCITEQTGSARSGTIDAISGACACRIKTMLLTVALLVAVSAAFIIHKAQVAGRSAQASLGWMSAQWLAEHRASHPS